MPVHLGTCQTHCEVRDSASGSSRGAFIPRTAEPLQGTVVGVQGQQMLVCAQDGAHLLRRQSSHPSRSQKHTSVRPVCSER